jgi:hypothetical protein
LVPHLTTALNGPLLELEQRVLDARTALAAAGLELEKTAPAA